VAVCPASVRYFAQERPERPPPIMAIVLGGEEVGGREVNLVERAAASWKLAVFLMRGGVGYRWPDVRFLVVRGVGEERRVVGEGGGM